MIILSDEELDSLFALKVRKIDELFSHERLGVEESYIRYLFLHKIPFSVIIILLNMLHSSHIVIDEEDCISTRAHVNDLYRKACSNISQRSVLKQLQGRDQRLSSWKKTFPLIKTDDKELCNKYVYESIELNSYYTTSKCCEEESKDFNSYSLVDSLMIFSGILQLAVENNYNNLDFLSINDDGNNRKLNLTFKLLKKYKNSIQSKMLYHINNMVVNPNIISVKPKSESVKNMIQFVQTNWENENLLYSFINMICESGFSNIVAMIIIVMFGINLGNGTRCLCTEFIELKRTIDFNYKCNSISEVSPFILNEIVFKYYKPIDNELYSEFIHCKSLFNVFEYAFDSLIELIDLIPNAKRISDEIIANWKYHTIKITTPGSKYAIKSYTGDDYPYSCFASVYTESQKSSYYPSKSVVHEKRKSLLKSIKNRNDFIFKGHQPCSINRKRSSIIMAEFENLNEVGDPNNNVITIGNKNAFLIEELTSLFNNYKLAMIPQINNDESVDSNTNSLTMLSVGSLSILEKISIFNNFDELYSSIQKIKIHRKTLCDHIDSMRNEINSDVETVEHMKKLFKQILKLGMNIRGWKGGSHSYPMKSIETVIEEDSNDYDNMMLRIAKSFIKIDNLIDTIPNYKCKTLLYELPQFSHKTFDEYNVLFIPSFIEEQGNTLLERIELMKQGERSDNIFSCIRMGSNFILASVYFYTIVLFNDEPKFNISEMVEIF